MRLKAFFGNIFKKLLFNPEWRCLLCGKEIFDGEYFCDKCLSELPFNNGAICGHCGREVVAFEPYCSTCKGKLIALDTCRSAFSYKKPISTLIKRLKYGNQRFLIDYFADRLSKLYFSNYFNADGIVFVPMTDKAKRKRGYNQSELLAEKLSSLVLVPVLYCLEKVKDTKRQATLNAAERRKNLESAFRVTDKKSVKGKTLLIVDDVTTTGSTAEVIAERLKKAGAKTVYLLTVARTPPIEKY
jgi:competence protein ComFC